MRALTGIAALLLLVACADDKNEAKETATTTTTSPFVPFVAEDCPVRDDEFCGVAAQAANALATRDADELANLSRAGAIVCAEMNVEYFPGCDTQETLEGYGVSGPDLIVHVVDESEYLVHLRGTTEELESGSMQIFGVGTCGPNRPTHRTYHLSWTATVRDTDGTEIPIVGSFEFGFVDEWRILLFYVGTLEDWLEQPNDPMRDSFCEAGRTLWRN